MLVEIEGWIWELCAALVEDVPRHDGAVRHWPPDHLWLSTGRRHAGDLETPLPEVIRPQVWGRNLLEIISRGGGIGPTTLKQGALRFLGEASPRKEKDPPGKYSL